MNQLSEEEKEVILEKMKEYINSYRTILFESEETFIKDMMYGIGSSLSKKYTFANGFEAFLERLKLILK
jgi:hypothetical protein